MRSGVERGEHDPARAAVEVAVDREQAVAEQRDQVAEAAVAPAEVAAWETRMWWLASGPSMKTTLVCEDAEAEHGPVALVGVEQQPRAGRPSPRGGGGRRDGSPGGKGGGAAAPCAGRRRAAGPGWWRRAAGRPVTRRQSTAQRAGGRPGRRRIDVEPGPHRPGEASQRRSRQRTAAEATPPAPRRAPGRCRPPGPGRAREGAASIAGPEGPPARSASSSPGVSRRGSPHTSAASSRARRSAASARSSAAAAARTAATGRRRSRGEARHAPRGPSARRRRRVPRRPQLAPRARRRPRAAASRAAASAWSSAARTRASASATSTSASPAAPGPRARRRDAVARPAGAAPRRSPGAHGGAPRRSRPRPAPRGARARPLERAARASAARTRRPPPAARRRRRAAAAARAADVGPREAGRAAGTGPVRLEPGRPDRGVEAPAERALGGVGRRPGPLAVALGAPVLRAPACQRRVPVGRARRLAVAGVPLQDLLDDGLAGPARHPAPARGLRGRGHGGPVR